MPSLTEIATVAAQGLDTEDFLDHIAWAKVIKPKLERDKALLTKELVDAVLSDKAIPEGKRERVAGQIFGIDHAIKTIEGIVRKGRDAESVLAKNGIHLQDL